MRQSLFWIRAGLVIACLALCLFCIPADADVTLTQIGPIMHDDAGFVLAMQVVNIDANNSQKGAALAVVDSDKPDDIGKLRVVVFDGKEHWNQFLLLWEAARSAPKADPNLAAGMTKDIGIYKDNDDNEQVKISIDKDGVLMFTIDEIKGNGFTAFFLKPADFAAFEDDVVKINTYFNS